MERITEAARRYNGNRIAKETYDDHYDAFIAGATALETEEYYKSRYSHTAGEGDYSNVNIDSLENTRKEVMNLISSRRLLTAIKTWKEANPGMGLREAKDYIDTLIKNS